MAYVTLTANGAEIGRQELTKALLIGRSPECDLSVRDILMSRQHCRVEACGDGRWRVVDLGSKNGTRVGWQKVKRHVLADGDEVRIGRTTLCFFAGAFVPPDEGEVRPEHIVRPEDPDEALTGTMSGFVYLDEAPEEGERVEELAGMTWGRPARDVRPRTDAAATVQSVLAGLTGEAGPAVAELPSGLRPGWSKRPLPRPMVYADRTGDEGSGLVDLSLQVPPQLLEPAPMRSRTVRRRGLLHLTLLMSVVVVLAATLFAMCGWLVMPPGRAPGMPIEPMAAVESEP